MEIKIPSDKGPLTRYIELKKFPALEGWDIQREFKDFAASKDANYRRAYVMRVLSYALVIIDGTELPFKTDALIDNHLGTWENVQLVFESILSHNGIDAKTHADEPAYWTNAGYEMANAFLTRIYDQLGPALAMIQSQK